MDPAVRRLVRLLLRHLLLLHRVYRANRIATTLISFHARRFRLYLTTYGLLIGALRLRTLTMNRFLLHELFNELYYDRQLDLGELHLLHAFLLRYFYVVTMTTSVELGTTVLLRDRGLLHGTIRRMAIVKRNSGHANGTIRVVLRGEGHQGVRIVYQFIRGRCIQYHRRRTRRVRATFFTTTRLKRQRPLRLQQRRRALRRLYHACTLAINHFGMVVHFLSVFRRARVTIQGLTILYGVAGLRDLTGSRFTTHELRLTNSGVRRH